VVKDVNANFRCKAELLPKTSPKLPPQLSYASAAGIPFAIIFGEQEVKEGKVNFKNFKTQTQDKIERSSLVVEVKKRLDAFKLENSSTS
jgi:histidyl-tRNA synthetase